MKHSLGTPQRDATMSPQPTVEQLLKRLERRRNVMDRQEVSLAAKTKRIEKLRAQVEELENKRQSEKKENEAEKTKLKNEIAAVRDEVARTRRERDQAMQDTLNAVQASKGVRDERNILYSWIAFAGHLDHYHIMTKGWRQINFDYTKFLKEKDIDIM